MKVLMFAPHFPPAERGGGPIRTLAALARTAPADVSLSIITRDQDLGTHAPLPVERNEWVDGPNGSRVRYTTVGQLRALAGALWSSRGQSDYVYVNSFFDARLGILPVLLHRLRLWRGARLLLAPRGQLSGGALALKAPKKQAFIRAFRLVASRRVIWHASGPLEAAEIRALFGRDAAVVIREDETDLPLDALPLSKREPGGALRLVFVSRISEKKGLTVLLAALRQVKADVVLDIYGPEEDQREVAAAKRIVEQLPENVSCRFLGDVPFETVREVFSRYDVFAFPTAGENFGHVIAESLSAGCAVMVTDTTPWSDTVRAGGGVVVESRDVADWTRSIEQYAAGGPDTWERSRPSTAAAYSQWAKAPKGRHVFELLPTS